MQKVVLITGSSSGIGNYLLEQYVALEKYKVIGIDRKGCINIHNGQFFTVDLRDEQNVLHIFAQIPHIDLAINCAGVLATRKELLEFNQSEITNNWQDNFLPTFNAMINEIKIMQHQQGGKIINIASILGHIGIKHAAAYSIAKSSIISMTKVAAIEYAKNNIKINSISPATIDTPMLRKKYNGTLPKYDNVYYTNDCGHMSDVYHAVTMLENNEFMTGTDIKIDGGLTDLFKL